MFKALTKVCFRIHSSSPFSPQAPDPQDWLCHTIPKRVKLPPLEAGAREETVALFEAQHRRCVGLGLRSHPG